MQTAPSTQSTKRATFRPRVRRLGPGRYLIESSTTRGIGHTATATRCSCKGASFGHVCRHMKLVAALEPRFQAWYSQAAPVVASATAPDAHLAEAERRLTSAHRALADSDEQSDEYALLLRAVDQAERAVAALSSSAMRAA
jgi:hypothetical protein